MELAENFLEPFAKGLRFYSRKSRRTLMVSQVVSLCLLSGIFEGEKLFPVLLKQLGGTSAHRTFRPVSL